MTYITLIVGFVILIKGADLFVNGASSLAKRFHLSDLVIGLTVVSLGSSAPELIVNSIASFRGSTDLAVGNILGSNTANIFLGIGVASTIHYLRVHSNTVWKEIPFSLLAVLVLSFLANDRLIDGADNSTISRSDGLVLLSFLVIFLYYIYAISKEGTESGTGEEGEEIIDRGLPLTVGFILIGITGLTLGGKWVVDGAIGIARSFGASEALIGLTIVAIGTSLPEIVTSGIAAYRKNADIAIGNIVGSNIFNIFWVMGLIATISPVTFSPALNTDIFVVLIATLLLFAILFIGKRHTIERWEGIAFIATYFAYIAFLVIRG